MMNKLGLIGVRMTVMIGLAAFNFVTCGIVIFLVYVKDAPSLYEVDRTVYLDLSLSILNAMIGILAIVLAVSAFWGYSALREAAQIKAAEVADDVARQVSQRYADPGGTIAIGQALIEAGEKAKREAGGGADFPQQPTRRMRPLRTGNRPPLEGQEL